MKIIADSSLSTHHFLRYSGVTSVTPLERLMKHSPRKTANASSRLRRQGRAIVITIPKEIAQEMNWKEGDDVIFIPENGELKLVQQRVRPRKRKLTPDELVADLNSDDISTLKEACQPFRALSPSGREVF